MANTRERPILFSGPMVRAILEGRKTQTRRIVKRQGDMEFDLHDPHFGPYWEAYISGEAEGEETRVRCPYGKPSDRLWVRETHRYWWPNWTDPGVLPCRCRYAADDSVIELPVEWEEGSQFSTPADVGLDAEPKKWRPSIYTPRWASRITLEINDVRVEKLQSITPADAIAEGCPGGVDQYWALWDSIHGAGSWNINPFVWVVDFRSEPPTFPK